MLNDCVALVARDHSDVEEATVLGVAHRLESAQLLVTIVLRRLHDADARILESRRQIAQPVGIDDVVAVDHRDDRRIVGRLLEREVERAGLEARERADMEEAEAVAEPRAVRLHGPPDALILRVVVDDEHFEIRIVEPGERVQRLDEHLGRLVVGRDVDGNLGRRRPVGQLEHPESPHRCDPVGLRPLVRLGEQHQDDPQHSQQQQHT